MRYRHLRTLFLLLFIIYCVELTENEATTGKRVERAMQPCLTCTVLNKAQCCQKHGKCCNVGQPNVQIRPQQVTPPTRIVVNRPQQPTPPKIIVKNPPSTNIAVKQRYLPIGKYRTFYAPRCPARNSIYVMMRQQTCTPCNPDGSCSPANTVCCPPPVLCCRRRDFQGYCPLTAISARCCRRCVNDNSCRSGEGCCAQPGHQGCCGNGCSSASRNCPNFNNNNNNNQQPQVTVTSTATRTVTVTQHESTEPPPPTVVIDRTQTVYIEGDDGNPQQFVVTILIENGKEVTVTQNNNGGYDTLADIVTVAPPRTTEVTETITQGEDVILVETIINGVTYLATPVGGNGYVVTITTIVNGKQEIYVTTIYDSVETITNDITITTELPAVTITEGEVETVTRNLVANMDYGNGQLEPSFRDF